MLEWGVQRFPSKSGEKHLQHDQKYRRQNESKNKTEPVEAHLASCWEFEVVGSSTKTNTYAELGGRENVLLKGSGRVRQRTEGPPVPIDSKALTCGLNGSRALRAAAKLPDFLWRSMSVGP